MTTGLPPRRAACYNGQKTPKVAERMRLARILSLVVLVAVLFVTVDLGINCLGALVPELQDGIPYYSLLQRWFGVWEGQMRTRPDFVFVFSRWLWISFAVFVENAVLWGISIWKQGR